MGTITLTQLHSTKQTNTIQNFSNSILLYLQPDLIDSLYHEPEHCQVLLEQRLPVRRQFDLFSVRDSQKTQFKSV